MSVETGKFYRHFKGGLYQVLNIAKHCDTSEQLVVYQALYGTFEVYARPLESFCEMLSPEKYPDRIQQHRFEEISRDEISVIYGNELKEQLLEKYGQNKNKAASAGSGLNGEFQKGINTTVKSSIYNEAITAGVSPVLIMFLEADSADKKLEVIKNNYLSIDEKTLTNIEVSLDIIGNEGTLDDRIRYITDNLRTKAQYENMRLR